ncbi:MAG: aspartyl-phosphate phosphatase Spo0E family protein [Bacillota bacterium]
MQLSELIVNKLECKINVLRIRMIYTGNIKGLNHPATIKYSKELDKLVYKYQYLARFFGN